MKYTGVIFFIFFIFSSAAVSEKGRACREKNCFFKNQSTVTFDGSVENIASEGIGAARVYIEYSTSNLADRSFPKRIFLKTDSLGHFKAKLKKCWRNMPITIIAIANNYYPDKITLKDYFDRKNYLKINLLSEQNKIPVTNIVGGRFRSSSFPNDVNNVTNQMNVRFKNNELRLNKGIDDGALLSVESKREESGISFSIIALQEASLFSAKLSKKLWYYDDYSENKKKEMSCFIPLTKNSVLSSASFIMELKNGFKYRCCIECFLARESDETYSVYFYYVLEYDNDQNYYYVPKTNILNNDVFNIYNLGDNQEIELN